MAEVVVEIAGRRYPLTCRDGDEAHVRALAGVVDGKARDAERAVGGVNEVRQLLLAALLLADELGDARQPEVAASATHQDSDAAIATALNRLAERLEALAARLEKPGTTA